MSHSETTYGWVPAEAVRLAAVQLLKALQSAHADDRELKVNALLNRRGWLFASKYTRRQAERIWRDEHYEVVNNWERRIEQCKKLIALADVLIYTSQDAQNAQISLGPDSAFLLVEELTHIPLMAWRMKSPSEGVPSSSRHGAQPIKMIPEQERCVPRRPLAQTIHFDKMGAEALRYVVRMAFKRHETVPLNDVFHAQLLELDAKLEEFLLDAKLEEFLG